MATIVYSGGNIQSQTMQQLEAIIATLAANPASCRCRIRGHVLYTGPAVGPVVIRIRQGSITGPMIYQANLAVAANSAPFEVEDDSGWVTQANANTNGLYVLTAQGTTGTGIISGGTIYLESVP